VDEVLDVEKPDAVVSVLPIEEIAEVGSILLRRGVPCVLEKPPGRSPEEASALAEVARQTGTPHMVSMNRRFSPYLNRAIEWTKSAGLLRHIRGQMFRHARREPDFLWGTGVHVVDAVRYVAGEVASAETGRIDHSSQSAPWYVITLRFASGCTGSIEIFPTAGSVSEEFELFGEGFHAHVRTMGANGEFARCWKDGKLEIEMQSDGSEPLFLRDGSYEETSSFLNALRTGTPLHPSLEDVLLSLELSAHQ
jgi:predicted dehydrogenase